MGRHSTIETKSRRLLDCLERGSVACLKTVVPAAINVNNRVTFLPTQIVGQQIMFVDTLIQVIMYIYKSLSDHVL